jgi:hypothetical protein
VLELLWRRGKTDRVRDNETALWHALDLRLCGSLAPYRWVVWVWALAGACLTSARRHARGAPFHVRWWSPSPPLPAGHRSLSAPDREVAVAVVDWWPHTCTTYWHARCAVPQLRWLLASVNWISVLHCIPSAGLHVAIAESCGSVSTSRPVVYRVVP